MGDPTPDEITRYVPRDGEVVVLRYAEAVMSMDKILEIKQLAEQHFGAPTVVLTGCDEIAVVDSSQVPR